MAKKKKDKKTNNDQQNTKQMTLNTHNFNTAEQWFCNFFTTAKE
jgi:hypothetical protein